MTAKEFYEMMKEYAKKEMFAEAEKAQKETDASKIAAYQAASHEASKFYSLIEMSWLDVK